VCPVHTVCSIYSRFTVYSVLNLQCTRHTVSCVHYIYTQHRTQCTRVSVYTRHTVCPVLSVHRTHCVLCVSVYTGHSVTPECQCTKDTQWVSVYTGHTPLSVSVHRTHSVLECQCTQDTQCTRVSVYTGHIVCAVYTVSCTLYIYTLCRVHCKFSTQYTVNRLHSKCGTHTHTKVSKSSTHTQ